MVTIDIAITSDSGETETLTRTIDPKQIKLGFLRRMEEAQSTQKWAALIPAYAKLLRITVEQADELTIEQLEAVGAALRESTTVNPTSA